MSEIKTALDEGRKACEELFDRDYFGNHNVEMSELSAIWDRFDEASASHDTLLSELRSLEQQLDVAREFCRQLQIENKQLKAQSDADNETNLQLNLKNMELQAENKKLGETNEQLGDYYIKINSMYWNDEIFEMRHGEGLYTDEFVKMIDDL